MSNTPFAIRIDPQESQEQGLRFLYESLVIETRQQNLTDLDPQLTNHLHPSDCFSLHDLTVQLKAFVKKSGFSDGVLVTQIQHTSATLVVNELDEPMLLGDIMKKMRLLVPKEDSYLHNSPLRTVNLCEEDTHCDRNADAHVKATLLGCPSISLIVRNGQLVLGQWQRIALLDFDGPRRREVLVQLMGQS